MTTGNTILLVLLLFIGVMAAKEHWKGQVRQGHDILEWIFFVLFELTLGFMIYSVFYVGQLP